MSGRGGKRRQVLQLGSASKLHRYGYSKGFHTSGKKGKGSLPVLVGNYSNSDSEDSEDTEEHTAADLQEEEEIIASDTPDATVNQEQPADMDDELKSFLSEIEAIPAPTEADTTEQPPSPMEDHKTEPEKAVEADLDAEIPVEPAQDVQKPVAKPKQSSHHYSMFVKGESEFVHSPKQETEDVKSPAVLQDKDIPHEPTTNWQMVKDEHTQYYYYWNTVTNEVTWEIPTEYTQYLLLHREYEEKVAKYTPEQLQKLKEKHAVAAGSGSGDSLGDVSTRLAHSVRADKSVDFHSSLSSTTQGLDERLSQGILNSEHANGGVKETARSRSVSPRPEASQDSKHHKHKKEKKTHHKKKHKRRHDDSQSDEDRHSPKVPDPKKPPVLSSEASVVSVLTGNRLTSIVPYLSDEDDSDEDNNLEPVPQLGSVAAPATDSLDQDREENPTHKEKSTKEDPPQPELSSPVSQDSSNSMAVVAFQSEPTQTADAASSSPVLVLPQPSPPPKEEEEEKAADDQTQEDNPDLMKSITLETDQPSPSSDADLSKHKLDTDSDRHMIDSPGSGVTTQLDDQEINKIMSAIVDPISATQAADETHNGTKADSIVVTHRIKEPPKSRPKEVIDMFADDFPVPVPTHIKDVTPVVKGSSVIDDHINKSPKLSEIVTEEEVMEISENDVHIPEKEQQVSNVVQDDSLRKASKTQENKLEKTGKTQENKLEKTGKTQENNLDKTSKIKEGSLEKSKTEEHSQEKTGKMQENSLENTSKSQENSLEKTGKTQENKLEKTGKTQENSLDKMSKIQETDLQRESKTPKRSLEKRSRSQENNLEKRSKTQESSSEKRSKIQEERSEKKSKSRDDSKDKNKSRSLENSAEKSPLKSRSRTQGNNSEKIRSRTSENSLEKGRSKTRESGTEKSRSKTQENSSEKGRSRIRENSSENIRSKTQEKNSDKNRHKIRENSSEKIRSKTQENRSEKSRNKVRENSSNDKSNFVEKKTLKNVNIVGYASDDEEEDIVRETASSKAEKPTHIQQKDRNKESKRHKKDSKKLLSSSSDINLGREIVSRAATPEVTSEATIEQVSEKQPEKISDDDDIDFDVDDIDRALEAALEKKLEKKKIELQEITDNREGQVKDETICSKDETIGSKDETIGCMNLGEPVPGQVVSDTPGVQIKGLDNGSENGVKPNSTIDPLRKIAGGDKGDESSQPGDVKLLADIKDMAELALSKLEFLDISTDNLSRLQVLFIELQTRFTDWASGGLSTQYFHGQLKTAEDLLEQYELSAVPEGWACQWDRSNNRYYYRNKVTDSIQWEYPEQEGKADVEVAEQPTAENSDESGSRVRERASDEHHRARSSGSSRHRRRDDKEKSKHDRHSSSRHYHRKRRRGRDRSNSSDSSSESQHRRHRKSKKKKKHRSERSPSVEIVDYMDDNLDEVQIIDAPITPTTALTPQSASSSPSTAVPPASPPASPTAADASTVSHQTIGTGGGPDGVPSGTGTVQDGLDADLDGFPLQSGEENLACDEDMPGGEFADGTAQGEAAVVVNPAVISKPPQIVIQPQMVAALNPDAQLIAELHSTNQNVVPAQASLYPAYPVAPPTDQAPPTAEMATESSEASLEATKKKKKDKKSLATGSSIMMKKKHMSSMVQKWQKVKIEVEKEDRAKELRQAAIRKKIEELKNTDKSDKQP